MSMLFGDSPRFYSPFKSTTKEHVGPGTYYFADEPLKKKSFSMTEPMTSLSPKKVDLDRSHHYMSGVLMTSGAMGITSKSDLNTPGPGQYFPLNSSITSFKSPTRNHRSRSFSMGTSPRMTYHTSIIKNDIEVYSDERGWSNGMGPGQYFPDVTTTSLLLKSFNIRATKSYSPIPRKRELNLATSPRSPRGGLSSPRSTFSTPRQKAPFQARGLSPIDVFNYTV